HRIKIKLKHLSQNKVKTLTMKKRILALVTGGTFDKEYNMINGELFFKDTHLPEIFQRGRSTLDITVRTLMMIDSVEMTENDRSIIAQNCKRTESKHIIITHGTDTMVETAKYLAESGIEGKTIVLLGAMIPYKFGMSSDGFFNLGAALAFAQSMPNGIYIAMHGECFDWDDVRKNRESGYFVHTKNQS
ncbi:MAG: L-asparaginase (EC, partial [uncultured Aureispira sp.]